MSTGVTVQLLGTGSPRPSLERSQPATLLEADGHPAVLLDAGDGTTRQLLRADTRPQDLAAVLLTHLHKDHILGYPALLWGAWLAGGVVPPVWGPPGTKRMHDTFFVASFEDDLAYSKEKGFEGASIDDVQVTELTPGQRFHLAGFEVETVKTPHEFFNLAYRFTAHDASIVCTGDTAYSDAVVELADGADLFVCEATIAPSPAYATPRDKRIFERLRKGHCEPREAAAMASKAGVGHLVLNHLIPRADVDAITRQCREEFDGRVTVGSDLDVFSLPDPDR